MSKRRTQKIKVHLRLLKAADRGATCEELEKSLRLRHQSCSARLHDLRREGKIIDGGERRLTRSGRSATVWRALLTPVIEMPSVALP